MCSRSRSSSGSRNTKRQARTEETRSCPERANSRSGAWCSASAGARGSVSSRRISCATASPTASLRESGARRCRSGGRSLGHSRIDTTQLYTDEIEVDELAAALAKAFQPGTHKRRLIWRRLKAEVAALPSRPCSGGGGNRTRVRGRTGRASTSLGRDWSFARTAGSRPTHRRASHPGVSRRRRLALLWRQPVFDAGSGPRAEPGRHAANRFD